MAGSEVYGREHYLSQLRPFYEADDLVKVMTGIRRCGKSCLLLSVMGELRARGVPESNIAYLNLDRSGYRRVTTPDLLERAIGRAMAGAGPGLRYLFIDEVQNVRGFVCFVKLVSAFCAVFFRSVGSGFSAVCAVSAAACLRVLLCCLVIWS